MLKSSAPLVPSESISESDTTLSSRTANDSINRRILRATVTVGVFTLVAKSAFVARDLVVAWRFGRSPLFEAFLVAFVVPFSLVDALSVSLTATFLPAFIKFRHAGKFKEAQELYNGLLSWLVLVSGAITLLCVLMQPLYVRFIAASLSMGTWDLIYNLLWLTAPAAFLTSVSIFWRSILHAEEKFFLASLITVCTPLASIILLFFAVNTGVLALSLGLLFGAMIEVAILAFVLKRMKISLWPRWRGLSPSIRHSLGQWTRLLLSAFFINAMTLVDTAMAGRLAAGGSVAALNYGKKAVTFPLDLSAIAFVSVIVPYFSKLVAAREWSELRKIVRRYLGLILAVNVPVVIALVVWAKPIVRLLFERGQFGEADTEIVSRVLVYYAFNLPFYVAFLVMMRLLASLRENTTAVWFSGSALLLNTVLNYVFSKYMGVAGIGLATSCVYFVLAMLLYTHTEGLLKGPFSRVKSEAGDELV